MKKFFNKLSKQVNTESEKLMNKLGSVADKILVSAKVIKKSTIEESSVKEQAVNEEPCNPNSEKQPDEPKEEIIAQSNLLNNKLSDEASQKFKSMITIDEDEKDFIYNVQHHDEDEDEEEETEDSTKQEEAEISQPSVSQTSSTPKVIDKLEIFKKKSAEDQLDISSFYQDQYICHQILIKGLIIDTRYLLSTCKCQKFRYKSKLRKLVGLDNREDMFFMDYLAYFEDFFLYFIKDEQLANTEYFERRVSKHHNLKKLHQIEVSDFETQIKIVLIFKLHDINQEFSDEKYEIKDIYFGLENANHFFRLLKLVLKKYKIPMNFPELGSIQDT